MLNEEKISLMTKLALYEQNEGKKQIPMSKYYQNDYISLNLINSAIIGTIVYILIVAAVIVVYAESIVNKLTEMDLVAVGKKLVICYGVFIVIYLLASYAFYAVKFKKIRKNLNEYNADLKKLYAFYKREEGLEKDATSGFEAVDVRKAAAERKKKKEKGRESSRASRNVNENPEVDEELNEFLELYLDEDDADDDDELKLV